MTSLFMHLLMTKTSVVKQAIKYERIGSIDEVTSVKPSLSGGGKSVA